MSDDMITIDPAEGAATRRKLLTGMGVAAGGGLLAMAGSRPAQAAVEEGTTSPTDPNASTTRAHLMVGSSAARLAFWRISGNPTPSLSRSTSR